MAGGKPKGYLKYIRERVSQGATRAVIKSEIKKRFPDFEMKWFANFWWAAFNTRKKDKVKTKTTERSITKDSVWNDVVALVKENESLHKEIHDLREWIQTLETSNSKLDAENKRLLRKEEETLKYRIALHNGEVNRPIESE